MQVKKQQLEPDMEQWTGFKLRKEYVKAIYCHHAYLSFKPSTSCTMPGWMKIAGRNINNLRYADDTTLNGRKRRGTKEPLNEGERGE